MMSIQYDMDTLLVNALNVFRITEEFLAKNWWSQKNQSASCFMEKLTNSKTQDP